MLISGPYFLPVPLEPLLPNLMPKSAFVQLSRQLRPNIVVGVMFFLSSCASG